MTNEFYKYELSEEVLESLNGLGYNKPRSIQQKVILPMLAGKNLVVKAHT